MIELLTRILNGFITLFISYKLYGLFKQTQRRFYLYWGAGFIFYGTNILLRVFVPVIEINPIGVLAFLLNVLGFILMMTGIGDLVNKARITMAATVVVQLLLFSVVLSVDSEALAWVMLLVPHMIIILNLGFLYIRYKVDVSIVVAGWLPLLLANYALSINLLDILIVDLVSAASKIIVFYGMSKPSFSFLADDLRKFILAGLPTEYPEEHSGGFFLIELDQAKTAEIEWIKKRIRRNHAIGVRTILFSFYDIIHPSVFIEETKEMLYLVRVLQSRSKYGHVFENHVISVNDDLNIIQLVLGDIVKASVETTIPAEVIIYTLTNVILVHGWNRVYSILLTKNPELRASGVSVSCFLYPEAHGDTNIVSKFESIARDIIRK